MYLTVRPAGSRSLCTWIVHTETPYLFYFIFLWINNSMYYNGIFKSSNNLYHLTNTSHEFTIIPARTALSVTMSQMNVYNRMAVALKRKQAMAALQLLITGQCALGWKWRARLGSHGRRGVSESTKWIQQDFPACRFPSRCVLANPSIIAQLD